jgi:TolB-like protein
MLSRRDWAFRDDPLMRIRIGDWTVRPSLNLIECDGRSIRLEPRAMDLLVYLATMPDGVASADELLREVWQGRVFDGNVVYKKINQLRRALGDDARASRFIETIPKRGYRLVASVSLDRGDHDRRTNHVAPETTVAVLPFISLDGSEHEYFADGLTEELLNRLAGVPQLRVAARTSSFYFKGRNDSLQTVGRMLGVRYVVNGSVRRSRDVLRINVRLDDATKGDNVWSDRFERACAEVFAIQDEIALAIAHRLEVTLRGQARLALTQRSTHDTAAQDFFYRAKYFSERFTIDGLDSALACYERAIAIDAGYARAYVGIAESLRIRGQVGEVHPADPAWQRARDSVRTALELDPGNADAHALHGTLLWLRHDWKGAERELRLAEQLDADGLNVLQGQFFYYMTCGSPPERMLHYTRRLAQVHPLNPYAAQLHGIAYWHLHEFEAALREFDRLLGQFPDYYPIRWSRYMTLNELGRDEEALEEAKRAVELYDYGDVKSFLGVAYARVGDHTMARRIYTELANRTGRYWSPTLRGVLLYELGERSAALDAFEQAYDDCDWQLPPAMHYKMLAGLHGDRRFERLVDLLGQRSRYDRLARLLAAGKRRVAGRAGRGSTTGSAATASAACGPPTRAAYRSEHVQESVAAPSPSHRRK